MPTRVSSMAPCARPVRPCGVNPTRRTEFQIANPKLARRSLSRNLPVSASPWHGTASSRLRELGSRAALCVGSSAQGTETVVIIENDGVLVDLHTHGHRKAFNLAFDEMGYSCSQWSPHIYYDLLRFGDGTGEGLVRAYYDMVRLSPSHSPSHSPSSALPLSQSPALSRSSVVVRQVGWPIMLSTSDRPAFVEKIYSIKKQKFADIVDTRDFPLREGVKEFIEEADKAGARLVVLSGTVSDPKDHVVDAVLDLLGDALRDNIQVLNAGDVSNGGEDDDEELSFEQMVAQVQGKGKAKSAASFVRAVNLQSRGMGVRVDASVLVAVSNSLMSSAKSAGLFTCGVPPSLQGRGGYTAADGIFDGFGAGGGLTWRRLSKSLAARRQ